MRKLLLMLAAIGAVVATGAASANTVVSSSASAAGSGRVTAHLTKTSFTSAQAGNVKLVYAFSPASTRFGYLLSLKNGAKWVTVRSVNKTGSFKGSYTMTVKQLFGSNAVKIGQYRVKVSADTNNVTRSFTVVKPSSGGGSTTTPRAGHWSGSTTASNFPPSPVDFYATPDQVHIINFSFSYSLFKVLPSFPYSCIASGKSTQNTQTPIATKSFSFSDGPFYFSGTFDSPTSAHGTVGVQVLPSSCGEVSSGPQPWTATWQDASQP